MHDFSFASSSCLLVSILRIGARVTTAPAHQIDSDLAGKTQKLFAFSSPLGVGKARIRNGNWRGTQKVLNMQKVFNLSAGKRFFGQNLLPF